MQFFLSLPCDGSDQMKPSKTTQLLTQIIQLSDTKRKLPFFENHLSAFASHRPGLMDIQVEKFYGHFPSSMSFVWLHWMLPCGSFSESTDKKSRRYHHCRTNPMPIQFYLSLRKLPLPNPSEEKTKKRSRFVVSSLRLHNNWN